MEMRDELLSDFQFDPETQTLFEQLKVDFGHTAKKEVIIRAIGLLTIAHKAKQEGREVSVVSTRPK